MGNERLSVVLFQHPVVVKVKLFGLVRDGYKCNRVSVNLHRSGIRIEEIQVDRPVVRKS